MKYVSKNKLSLAIAVSSLSLVPMIAQANIAEDITQAIEDGKAYGDFRLRYEHVDQDNDLANAKGLTLRSRLGYNTGSIAGFSATIEFEDSRTVLGVDDYNDTLGHNTEYSVIADPETTEVDQAFLQYKNDLVVVKAGRQVINEDNQRFIGSVGWRQDRQVFDAGRITLTPVENLSLDYAYISKRNRVFSDKKDIDSKDNIVNFSYQTPFGKATTYAYLLQEDNATDKSYDTYGARFAGATQLTKGVKTQYTIEFARQNFSQNGLKDRSADYMNLEFGATVKGITAKLGYEVLGSDDSEYGFATPLATGHAFNGWTDQFLNTPDEGLVDASLTLSTQWMGVKFAVAYHDFSADDSTPEVDDLGSEVDFLVAKKFTKNYSGGLKYGSYSQGDSGAGKVDTDKAWVWVSAKF